MCVPLILNRGLRRGLETLTVVHIHLKHDFLLYYIWKILHLFSVVQNTDCLEFGMCCHIRVGNDCCFLHSSIRSGRTTQERRNQHGRHRIWEKRLHFLGALNQIIDRQRTEKVSSLMPLFFPFLIYFPSDQIFLLKTTQ